MTDTRIKVSGDSRDAQRAFRALADDIDRTSRAANDFGREIASVGFGVLGAGTIEEALTAAYDAAREALESYVERNREAAEVVEGTRLVLREMSDTFFDAALGGGNLEAILGTIQEAAQALTGTFGDNRDAIRQVVMDGWVTLLETVPTVIGVFNGFRAVVDGVRLVFVQFRMGIRVGITALLDMGRAIYTGLLTVLRELGEGITTIIDQMGRLAGAVDARLGTNLAAPFEGAAGRVDDFTGGLDDSIQRLETIGQLNRAMIQDEVVASQQASAEIIRGIEDRENARVNLSNSIDSFVERLRSGEVGEQALRAAVGEGTESIEEQAASLADLRGALAGYAQEWLGFHQRYKQGLAEEVELERERSAFVMERYQAEVGKQMELAQLRADAEVGAQLKVEDSISRTQAAYEEFGAASMEALQLTLAGQQTAAEAFRASTGDIVAAIGERVRAQAIAAGATGRPVLAGALFAAYGIIGGIAQKLGAAQGSGGGGGGGQQSGPTQNISISVNGMMGDRAAVSEEIGRLFDDANRRGAVRSLS